MNDFDDNVYWTQCCDPGCFIPDPDPRIFSSQGPRSYRYRYVLCKKGVDYFKKISSKEGAGSGIRKKLSRIRIPDLGSKKAADPGSGSATLIGL
jgi:hypothetical protein